MKSLFDSCSNFFKYGLDVDMDKHKNHSLIKQDNPDSRIVDFRCLQLAIEKFLSCKTKENAFNIYFCFCEAFNVFGKGYDRNTTYLLNMLCDHEANAGRLAASHRDHYIHSVMVFLIGLAIFESNKRFFDFYTRKRLSDTQNIYEEFLYAWGVTSLFHDIGYPFELSFTQMHNYARNLFGGYRKSEIPYVSYKNLGRFKRIRIPDEKSLTPNISVIELLRPRLKEVFSVSDQTFDMVVKNMPCDGRFTDHAFFSTILLAKRFFSEESPSKSDKQKSDKQKIEILTAVFAHNAFIRKLSMIDKSLKAGPEESPLTYLLLLCDALQDYGRTCYGINNVKENYAYDCDVLVGDALDLKLYFSIDSKKEAEHAKDEFVDSVSFININAIFDNFDVKVQKRYIKDVDFHLFDNFYKDIIEFAKSSHMNYLRENKSQKEQQLLHWDNLTLEFKMSNIYQVEWFANKLLQNGYIFTNSQLNMASSYIFSPSERESISIGEHRRWVQEKRDMGWKYSDIRDDSQGLHNLLVGFDALDAVEKDKDYAAFNTMLSNIVKQKYKIYRLFKMNRLYVVGVTGHKDAENSPEVEQHITNLLKNILTKQCNKEVVLLSCLADGADLITAKLARSLDIPIAAVFPFSEDEYKKTISENWHTLFEEVKSSAYLKIVCPAGKESPYLSASKFIAEESDELVALWNGVPSDVVKNPGGTFHTKTMAEDNGCKVNIIPVSRRN